MKLKTMFRYGWIVGVLLAGGSAAFAVEDMRDLHRKVAETRQMLQMRAAAEEASARREAAASREMIADDAAALTAAVEKAQATVDGLEKAVAALEAEEQRLEAQETALVEKCAHTDGVVRELAGVVRVNAEDTLALADGNFQNALVPQEMASLRQIIEQARFPGMDVIERMAACLWEEIRNAGKVYLTRADIIDRSGAAVAAQVLVVGRFTAAYRAGGETGFLNPVPVEGKLFALSQLPPRGMRKQLERYMDAQTDRVPMDICRGAALGQLTDKLSLWRQIPKGGPLVWPILAILVLGAGIVAERGIYLLRKKSDADGLSARLDRLAADGNWQACKDACRQDAAKPVARVVAAGLDCRLMEREAMENALQEAILKEVPPMERFLSTLGMLAAIAPLLGLLGTVTGMIDTFHVITRHGTGDPRLMSGGISEALVTTMLGLSVAIPIMLAHTLLNREVEKRIGQMEEKAVSLLNLVQKHRDVAA